MELSTTMWLSEIIYFRGRFAEVLQLHQAHLELARDLGDRFVEADALGKLGLVYLELGSSSGSGAAIAEWRLTRSSVGAWCVHGQILH